MPKNFSCLEFFKFFDLFAKTSKENTRKQISMVRQNEFCRHHIMEIEKF